MAFNLRKKRPDAALDAPKPPETASRRFQTPPKRLQDDPKRLQNAALGGAKEPQAENRHFRNENCPILDLPGEHFWLHFGMFLEILFEMILCMLGMIY